MKTSIVQKALHEALLKYGDYTEARNAIQLIIDIIAKGDK